MVPGDNLPSRLPCWNNGAHHWTLSGTDDRPTLQPSIHAPGTWHGWLIDGEFNS